MALIEDAIMYDYILDHLSQSDIDLIAIMAMTGDNTITSLLADIALSNTQTSLVFNSMACEIQQAINLL